MRHDLNWKPFTPVVRNPDAGHVAIDFTQGIVLPGWYARDGNMAWIDFTLGYAPSPALKMGVSPSYLEIDLPAEIANVSDMQGLRSLAACNLGFQILDDAPEVCLIQVNQGDSHLQLYRQSLLPYLSAVGMVISGQLWFPLA